MGGASAHVVQPEVDFMATQLFSYEAQRLSWSTRAGWRDRLWKHLLLEKLNTSWGYCLFLFLALSLSWFIGQHEASFAWAVLGMSILIPALIISFFHLRIGILLLLVVAFGVMGAKRLSGDLPLGMLIDAWLVVLGLGLFYRQTRLRNWKFLHHPLTWMVVAWGLYCALEFLNPWSRAELGWLHACRPLAGWLLLYVVALYTLKRPRHVMLIHRWWVLMAIVAALYGIWQHFFGLSEREFLWVLEDERRFDQLFLGDRYRIFSFFSDPAVLAMVTSSTAVLVMVLGWRPGASLRRRGIAAGVAMLLAGVTYLTGSKLALLLLPVGLIFYAILSLRRGALIASGIALLSMALILWLPIQHPVWIDFQESVLPTSWDGFQIRSQNQSWVQPFIWEHPIGAGFGKTGVTGERFAPDVWLSQFPPDSAYVRIAVEAGWIGLLLYLGLMFTVLWTGIRGLFRTYSVRLKAWYHAYLTFVFLVIVANFFQEVTTQLPTGIMFVIAMAVMVNLERMKVGQGSET